MQDLTWQIIGPVIVVWFDIIELQQKTVEVMFMKLTKELTGRFELALLAFVAGKFWIFWPWVRLCSTIFVFLWSQKYKGNLLQCFIGCLWRMSGQKTENLNKKCRLKERSPTVFAKSVHYCGLKFAGPWPPRSCLLVRASLVPLGKILHPRVNWSQWLVVNINIQSVNSF